MILKRANIPVGPRILERANKPVGPRILERANSNWAQSLANRIVPPAPSSKYQPIVLTDTTQHYRKWVFYSKEQRHDSGIAINCTFDFRRARIVFVQVHRWRFYHSVNCKKRHEKIGTLLANNLIKILKYIIARKKYHFHVLASKFVSWNCTKELGRFSIFYVLVLILCPYALTYWMNAKMWQSLFGKKKTKQKNTYHICTYRNDGLAETVKNTVGSQCKVNVCMK